METIDPGTFAGLAAITVAIMASIKKLLSVRLDKGHRWYGSLMNTITLIVAMGCAGLTYLFGIVEYPAWIANGVTAFFVAIGLYEPLTNAYRGIRNNTQ